MKILLTGSTGFVGRHLVPKLIHEGHHILEITIEPDVSEKLYGSVTEKYVISEDQGLLINCVQSFNPDAVIHLASFLTSIDDYETLQKLLNTNIAFFCRILDAIKNTNLKLFINTGTFAEYCEGNGVFDPAYLYAATKTASRSFLDYYSKVYKFKQSTVVPYTIYGGHDTQKKIIDLIYDSISSPAPIDLSPGEQILDFIHISDVTDFYIKLVENIDVLYDKSNFQLGTGVGHSLKQVAFLIEKVTQKKTNINWGGKQYRPSDIMLSIAKNDTHFKLLNWQANIQLERGISDFIKLKYY